MGKKKSSDDLELFFHRIPESCSSAHLGNRLRFADLGAGRASQVAQTKLRGGEKLEIMWNKTRSLQKATLSQPIINGKTEIDLDGSMFGTNNGTTDRIKMSRNLYRSEVILVAPGTS